MWTAAHQVHVKLCGLTVAFISVDEEKGHGLSLKSSLFSLLSS
jgi:hypothetical protein